MVQVLKMYFHTAEIQLRKRWTITDADCAFINPRTTTLTKTTPIPFRSVVVNGRRERGGRLA